MNPLATLLLFIATIVSCTQPQQPATITHQTTHTTMNNFTTSFLVHKTPDEAYHAIKNFKLWWSEDIEGPTDQLDQPFFYHYKDVHLCTLKPIELIPGKRLAYRVLNNHFNFVDDSSEWVNSTLIFDISPSNHQTLITFTHEGLQPSMSCYEVCNDAWLSYMHGSLKSLINTGMGKPNPKVGGLNEELVKKWRLPNK